MNAHSPNTIKRLILVSFVLTIFFGLSVALGISIGSSGSTKFNVFQWLFSNSQTDSVVSTIVWQIRLPRVLLAALVGATLSLGGLVFQALLRNPLAEPYILGVSGGAAVGAIFGILGGLSRFPGVTLTAFLGSMTTLGLLILMTSGRTVLKKDSLLLSGVMVNAFCSAFIMFLVSITQDARLHNILFWLMGDMGMSDINPLLCIFLSIFKCHEPFDHGSGNCQSHRNQRWDRKHRSLGRDLHDDQCRSESKWFNCVCRISHAASVASDYWSGSPHSGSSLYIGRQQLYGVVRSISQSIAATRRNAGRRCNCLNWSTFVYLSIKAESSMIAAIDILGLQHHFDQSKVLDRLDFSVSKGDFFVIIGPNGSGKTTLMKIISGILKPTKGKIQIQQKEIGQYSSKSLARTIGYVPQMVQTEFPFTVMEVVLMGRSPHLGLLGIEHQSDIEIAKAAIGFTDVDHLANRKLNELSGGECQRVLIARAICQEPEIMLLDEPTASLDLAHQIRIMDLMDKLREERQITVVMVSHDVNLAAMYGNKILLLKSGQVIKMGTPEEVIRYDTLESVYGCQLLVDESPLGSFPRITPVPSRYIP
jgi:iron complex transport system ATP-binding protein